MTLPRTLARLVLGTRRAVRRPAARTFETLESRIALHAGHPHLPAGIEVFPSGATSVEGASSPGESAAGAESTATSGLAVPVFNSLPGAAVSLYLDFDGSVTTDWTAFSPSITTPPYDQDGDLTSFGLGELDSIAAIWQIVAEDFAPFQVNVTTVEPPSFANGAAIRVAIGGNGSWTGANYGGIAYIDGFTSSSSNTVFVFSSVNQRNGDPKFVGDASSHESGHAFGLNHQSEYDATGAKVLEYSYGSGDGRAPIMGISYAAQRGLWWYGTSTSATTYQDDMAVVSRAQNGFGYRSDEDFNSPQTATPVVYGDGQVMAGGVISQTVDADYWSFTTGAGVVSLNVTEPANNNLDAKARLVDAAGNVIVDWQNPSDNFGASVTANVPAGFYRLVVGSNGSYGDVGRYSITGTIVPSASYPAPPDQVVATTISKNRIDLTWTDHATGESGYVVEQSTNRVSWTAIAQLDPDSTAYSATGLQPLTTYYYRVQAQGVEGDPTVWSDYSNTAPATTLTDTPAAPSNLAGVYGKKLTLTWRDNSNNETTFQVQRSTDGVAWSNLATLAANSTTYSTTKPARDLYYFRIVAVNAYGPSSPSNVITVNSKGVVGSSSSAAVGAADPGHSGWQVDLALNALVAPPRPIATTAWESQVSRPRAAGKSIVGVVATDFATTVDDIWAQFDRLVTAPKRAHAKTPGWSDSDSFGAGIEVGQAPLRA